MKIILSILFVFIFAFAAFGQIGQPTTKYKGKKIVEMSNMLGQVEYMKCKRITKPLFGTIVKRDFIEDEVTISSFVLADAKDERFPININNKQIDLLGHYTTAMLSALLTKGSKIQVTTYQCTGGGSGIFTYAETVKVLS